MSYWIIAIVISYLIGSIPFGFIMGKMRGVDIRQHGSKNIGATNVGRVLGKKLGSLCLILDMAKGGLPVLIAGILRDAFGTPIHAMETNTMLLWLCVGIAAVLGHMYSVFLRFGGGKGVATGFGSLVFMWPLLTVPALISVVVWIVTVKVSRYVSIASILGVFSLPIVCVIRAVFFMENVAGSDGNILDNVKHVWPLFVLTSLLGIAVLWKHRGNISRILSGDEPKSGEKLRPDENPLPSEVNAGDSEDG